ncbi:MAG: MFS transporter [Proteobacteria bacterium]|nr:MFS transporter [Pseudomonadota bacterium]
MSELFKFTFVVCFIAFLGDIGTTIYLPVFPELNQMFAVSSTLIKFSITIYYIGILLGTIFSGPLSDTYGRQHTLNFFLGLFIASSVLCAFSSVIYPFLAGRFLQGIGAAGAPIIALSISADYYKDAVYNKIVSFILVTIAIGPGSAPLIGGVIFKLFGWQMIFYFLAFMGILALGLSYYVKIEHRIERQELTKTLHEYLFFLRHPFFRYYWIMIGILYGAFYAFIVISPYVFRDHYGWSILEFASAGLLLAIANGLGPLFNKTLIEKIGSDKIILSGLTIVTTTLCLFLFAERLSHGIWLLILAASFIIGCNLIAACLTLKAIKVDPNFTGLASSIIILGKMLSAALVLIAVLFFPENIWTINYFFLTALLVCIPVYLKIRKAL